MPITYDLNEPLENLIQRLAQAQAIKDSPESYFGIRSSTLKIENNVLNFARLGFKESPFSAYYDTNKCTLKIAYDLASGNDYGGGAYQEYIPLPHGTRYLEFGIIGGDTVDQRSGKCFRDLDNRERLHAFFPNLK